MHACHSHMDTAITSACGRGMKWDYPGCFRIQSELDMLHQLPYAAKCGEYGLALQGTQ